MTPTFETTARTDRVTGAPNLRVGPGRTIQPSEIALRVLDDVDYELIISGSRINANGEPGRNTSHKRHLTLRGAWLNDEPPPAWAVAWAEQVRGGAR